MKHYCYLLLPEFSNLCLFNSIEPLRAANSFLESPGYKWSLASIDGNGVTSSSGFKMAVSHKLEDIPAKVKPDALIVLSSYHYQRHTSDDVVEQLKRLKTALKVIGGLDTGTYALAKAKLLNGYRATIHWAELDTFSEEFRNVEVCNNRYIVDRDRISAGGATTTLDLMLNIIRKDYGREIAIAVSELLIFDTERADTTPQREHVPSLLEAQTPRLAKAIKLMERNIENPLSMEEIASQIYVSQRQLERDFKNILGNTAVNYYSRLRVRFAQRLLKETSLSTTEISIRAGFNSRESFNRSYKRLLGRTPSEDRKS